MTRSATGWRSEAGICNGGGGEPASRQRAEGRVELVVRESGGRTAAARLAESGSARVRLPRGPGLGATAVLLNTAGGLAAGDCFTTRAVAEQDADLTVTTAAAEKIYKSEGAVTRIDAELDLACGARLDWLPQETILFDRARVARRLDVTMAADARLLAFEAVVFGRAARGEAVESGLWQDRWRIRRAGRLIYADTLRLEGPIAERLGRPTLAAGARALATLVHVAPDAPGRLEGLRELMGDARGDCAAGTWNGMLVARFLAPDIETLRADAARVITWISGRPLPRVWHL